MSTGVCDDKSRLIQEYQRTAEFYCAAVNNLAKKIGIVQKAEYERLSAATEKARYLSADAHDRLEHHIAKHGC